MDLRPIILAMAATACSVDVCAQINSKQSGGYAARAAAMMTDGNLQGCIDQCNVALELGTPERENLMWLRAVATFKEGAESSRGLLNDFLRQYPQSVHRESARLLLATLTFYGGDYPRALKEFKAVNRSALQLNEADDLDYRTAFSMLKLGDLAGAEPKFAALSDSRRYGNASRFYRGYIAYSREDYPEAERFFGTTDPGKAPGDMAPYYIGQIKFKQGNYVEALRIMQPLLTRRDIAPEFADEVERVCGESFYALGDETRAMAQLNPYISKHPEDAPLSARYIVGLDRYQTGDYEESIRLLAPVTELTDAMGQSAALTAGQAFLAQGNNAAALMQFEKAANLDFDETLTEMAYYNYAVAQVDGGRIPFGSSVQTLENFIKRYPKSRYAATVQDYLVKGYMATDDYLGALRSLNALKGNDSGRILEARQQVNFVLGTRALQSGKASEAVSYLTEARKYAGQNADIARQTVLWLGDAYYALGNYGSARKEYLAFLKAAPAADPNRVTAQYNLAYALFAEKKYADARTRFQAAYSADKLPLDARIDCLNRIADTYYYSKNFAEAIATYRRAYDLNPAAGDYSLFQIALMQGHSGKPADKIATLNDLISRYANSSLRPAAMTEKAMTQASTGKTQEAISTYGEVVTTYPATAQGRNALLQLAILYSNSGNTARAKEYYRLVISRHPSSTEAALAVQDLKSIYADEGNIEELNDFLVATKGAPQLDAVERNAIAAASLLKKARTATSAAARLEAARELLDRYPDAEGAEEALAIAARAEYDQGLADRALTHFSELEQRASSAGMRHTARMGVLRAARDMGDYARVIATSTDVLGSSAVAGADIPEVKFIRAEAFAKSGKEPDATALWTELAKTPANIYGTRAAYEIADAQFRANKLDKAAATAEKLIDANPPHAYWLARTFILYSDILRARGADFEADEYLRVLRSNYPGTEADIFQMIDKRLPKQ